MARRLLAEQPGELVLIGASMGARIALEATCRAPQRVRGVLCWAARRAPTATSCVRCAAETIAGSGRPR